jgi:hypothetical protein
MANYVARLVGTTIDCAELMRAGEVGDEEASAASVALTIMLEIWGRDTFTAMDVVKAMTPEIPTEDTGNAIAEALGELVGKRLDRPTAHSIGKLFQKRLVGRPAWVRRGKAVATLKKSEGHNANTYHINVSVPGQDSAATSSSKILSHADPSGKHTPHSPLSATRNPGDGDLGNEGEVGKVLSDFPENDAVFSDAKRATPGWRGRL